MEEDTNQPSQQSRKWQIFHTWKMYLGMQSTLGDTGSIMIAWQLALGSGNNSTHLLCWLGDLLQPDWSGPIPWSSSTSHCYEMFLWHSWWSLGRHLHDYHRNVSTTQHFPPTFQEASDVPYREWSTSGCFPNVLMAANLTYQLISNTGTVVRSFSTSQCYYTAFLWTGLFFPTFVFGFLLIARRPLSVPGSSLAK